MGINFFQKLTAQFMLLQNHTEAVQFFIDLPCGQLHATEVPGNQHIQKPTHHTARGHCQHTPEADCRDASGFEGGMVDHENRSEKAQKNMKFQPPTILRM